MKPGHLLADTWRLDRELGAGGLATVWAATHVRTATRAAIKVLHARHARDEEVRSRFAREGYAANQVPHPGVVRVLGDGVAGEDAFLVMELVEGVSLKARWLEAGRRLALTELAPIVRGVLDILAAAHEHRVVHRDVKPDNILLEPDGRPRLVDFGIARVQDGQTSATRTGVTLGTPAFMAPEQALARWAEVDGRTDLFAVAATAWMCLTGKLVHDASTVPELLIAAATRPARPLRELAPEIPEPVAAVLDRALAFQREARFPDARAMLAAWDAALVSRPVASRTILLDPPVTALPVAPHSVEPPAQPPSAPPLATWLPSPAPSPAPETRRPRGALLIAGAMVVATAATLVVLALASSSWEERRSPRAAGRGTVAEPATPAPPVVADITAFTQLVLAHRGRGVRVWHIQLMPHLGIVTVPRNTEKKATYLVSTIHCDPATGQLTTATEVRTTVGEVHEGFLLAEIPLARIAAFQQEALRRFQVEVGRPGVITLAAIHGRPDVELHVTVSSLPRHEVYRFPLGVVDPLPPGWPSPRKDRLDTRL